MTPVVVGLLIVTLGEKTPKRIVHDIISFRILI